MRWGLEKFLGTERWRDLLSELTRRADEKISLDRSLGDVFIAFLLCGCGPILTALERQWGADSSLLSTFGFGVSAVLAVIFQKRIHRSQIPPERASALSLTHTAFALGCIPALLVVALSPTLLTQREQILSSTASGSGTGSAFELIGMLIASTFWVAVTEEYLFRGLLLSTLRRWRGFSSSREALWLSIVMSSILFGLAHYPVWGLPSSLALTGIGLGFAVGYSANGERI
jgi:membrane protease YdiL (CAAX protease family)